MMNMKKATCLLLAAMLLQLAACGETDSSAVDTAYEAIETTSDDIVTTAPSNYHFDVQKTDYGSREITVLTGEHCKYEYVIEKETGDVMDDAIYQRNRSTEELLGVKFNFIATPNYVAKDDFYTMIRQSVQAGDGAYDIVNGLNVFTTPLIFDGMFRRLDNISTLHFDNPWWIPGETPDGSDKLYFAFTDASLSLYKDLYVMFFNKRILNDNKDENPYDLVTSGKWTVDAFLKLTADASRDLDGDSQITFGSDLMAYQCKHAANRSFLTSTKCSVFVIDEKGRLSVDGVTERLVNVYEKLRPFLSDNQKVYVDMEADVLKLSEKFVEGKVVFLTNCLMGVEAMRNMTDDYGIVPMPKYDENQDRYYSQIATSTSAIYLPKTVSDDDAEMLGNVLEALSYYSYLNVVPTYFETALSQKYARDEQVRSMLELIRANFSANVDFAYSSLFSSTNDVINQANKGVEIASWYAGLESSLKTKLDKYMKLYEELE